MNSDGREKVSDLDNWGSPQTEERGGAEAGEPEPGPSQTSVSVEQSPTRPEGAPRTAKKARDEFPSLQALLALAGEPLEIDVKRQGSRSR